MAVLKFVNACTVYGQFDTNNIDHITPCRYFDYKAVKSRLDSNPHTMRCEQININHLLDFPVAKSGRMLCVQTCTPDGKLTEAYYFNADYIEIVTRY